MTNKSKIRAELGRDRRHLDPQRAGVYSLRVAIVRRVDAKAMTVDLLVVGQGNDDLYQAVPITFPSSGRRNFLGVMPDVHDTCVVGFAPRETGRFRQPYIVAWVVPGALAGFNWMTTQPHAPSELSMSPDSKFELEGIFGQVRHKLRHIDPGNLLASSSQGSDLVLDESVLLTNRRGNELLLRDQDQALVVRTLQQFHAGSGFRIYGGAIQRDARLLQSSMISDGRDWTGPRQTDRDGRTLGPADLDFSDVPVGTLTASPIFGDDSDIQSPSFVNPYSQYERMGITSGRTLYSPTPVTSDAVSGGKPLYRLGLLDPDGNTASAASNTAIPYLTEYRIEVAHTSDGTLPVTEQTDGFDVDRTPEGDVSNDGPDPANPDQPFVEWVLGTAVENNPVSNLYAIPLAVRVFGDTGEAPAIYPSTGLGLGEHIAVFLRIRDVLSDSGEQYFWTWSKSGDNKTISRNVQWKSMGDMTFASDGRMLWESSGLIRMSGTAGSSVDNIGVEIESQQGAVVIRSGGSITQDGNPQTVGVLLDAQTGISVSSQQRILLSAPVVSIQDASAVSIQSNSSVSIKSGESINATTKTLGISTLGRAEYIHGGPLNGLPTNAPLRITKFTATPATGFAGGVVDSYTVLMGDLEENFLLGNRRTIVRTGDVSFVTGSGEVRNQAGSNRINTTDSGIELESVVGPITIESTTDALTMVSLRSALLRSRTQVTVEAPIISLASPGADFPGGVLTDGCIDGLTGLPFRNGGTFGSAQLRFNPA
jgi:hypothetical protein